MKEFPNTSVSLCPQSKMVLEIHGHHQTRYVHCKETCEDTGRGVAAWTASFPQPVLRQLLCRQSSHGKQDRKTSIEEARHLERGKNRNEKNCPEWDRHIEKVGHSIATTTSERPVTHRPVHSPRPQQRKQLLHARVYHLTNHANMQPLRPPHNQGARPFLPKDQEKSLMFCTGL